MPLDYWFLDHCWTIYILQHESQTLSVKPLCLIFNCKSADASLESNHPVYTPVMASLYLVLICWQRTFDLRTFNTSLPLNRHECKLKCLVCSRVIRRRLNFIETEQTFCYIVIWKWVWWHKTRFVLLYWSFGMRWDGLPNITVLLIYV